jgi:hypothetical protein
VDREGARFLEASEMLGHSSPEVINMGGREISKNLKGAGPPESCSLASNLPRSSLLLGVTQIHPKGEEFLEDSTKDGKIHVEERQASRLKF